jgi:hypothetical protein
MKKMFLIVGLMAGMSSLASAATVNGIKYDKDSSAASIAVDQHVRALNAAKIYPVDPTPQYMRWTVCEGEKLQGCDSGGGDSSSSSSN